MKNINYIYLGVMMVVVLGAIYLWLAETAEAPMLEDGVMCTADAMECPDGSYVGRTGPNCEFAECPAQVETAQTNQMITPTMPVAGQVVTSPLQLTGQAVGPWFFEASAPVEILDWQGNVIATSYVTAQGNWMTTNFVAFTGNITFTSPYNPGDPVAWKQGSLVFKKDNPSGEPQNDDQIIVPIQFAQ